MIVRLDLACIAGLLLGRRDRHPPYPPPPCSILGPEVNSSQAAHRLGNLTASIAKGTTRLPVTSANRFREGQWVRLWATNPAGRPAQAASSTTAGSGAARRRRRLLAHGPAAGQPGTARDRRRTRRLLDADDATAPGMQGGGAALDGSLDAYLYEGYAAACAAGAPAPVQRSRLLPCRTRSACQDQRCALAWQQAHPGSFQLACRLAHD